jgi:hypothetical protein
MITLRQLASIIIREASGGDASHDSQLGERTVILKIKMHLNRMLKVERYARMNVGDKSATPLFIYTYDNQTVNKDVDPPTLTLPEFMIDLPHNKGVHMIAPQCDPHRPYIRRHNQGVSRYLPCGDLLGEAGWWQEGYTVYLSPKGKVHDTAVVKLVTIGPDDLDNDSPLPVTPDMLPEMIQAVKAELLQQPPQDVINDNNKDLVVNG